MTPDQFWHETSPRVLIALIEEYQRQQTEEVIMHAIAARLKDPFDMRKKEKQKEDPVSQEAAWSAFTGGR